VCEVDFLFKSVYKLMERLGESSKVYHKDFKYEIGTLILIDRSIRCILNRPSFTHTLLNDFVLEAVDYVTPFCTSLTYEGLLDEVYEINAGNWLMMLGRSSCAYSLKLAT
jgi:hypothetical protein